MRSKRVTDPLNEHVKACICGKGASTSTSTSGSEHEGDLDLELDSSSLCLSHLFVNGFWQDDNDVINDDPDTDSCNSYRHHTSEVLKSVQSLLQRRRPNDVLVSHARVAVDMFGFFKSNKSMFLRNVMMYLRKLGHNAGICKSKWESSGAITAGSYEFIDVVVNGEERYFIDVDFAGEFDIARPTSDYASLLKILPRVYVGRAEEMKQIIRLMCDATKMSLKSRDLHLPPWRKNRYMQLKWFGSYRRTTNPVPSNISVPGNVAVKCKSVGFEAVDGGSGRFIFPAATRTR